MDLVSEIRMHNIQVICNAPPVFSKVFEDNTGTLALAPLPKLCPHTKHINVCYHHFHEHVHHEKIKIFPVIINDQIDDFFTKALIQNIIFKQYSHVCRQCILFQDCIESECKMMLQYSPPQKLTSHSDQYIAPIISRLLGLIHTLLQPK